MDRITNTASKAVQVSGCVGAYTAQKGQFLSYDQENLILVNISYMKGQLLSYQQKNLLILVNI